MKDRKLLSINEAAEQLSVEGQFVYNRVRSGEIPGAKIGWQWRIRQEDLDAWVRDQYEKQMPRGE